MLSDANRKYGEEHLFKVKENSSLENNHNKITKVKEAWIKKVTNYFT